MKVIKIINAINKYNQLKMQIQKDICTYHNFEAFDDEFGMAEMQGKIDKDNEELGKFLDTEI